MTETLQISEVGHGTILPYKQTNFSVPSSFLDFLFSNMFVVVGQVPSPLVYDWAPPPLLPGADHPHGTLLPLLLPQEVSGVRESGCTWVDIGEGEHIVAGT